MQNLGVPKKHNSTPKLQAVVKLDRKPIFKTPAHMIPRIEKKLNKFLDMGAALAKNGPSRHLHKVVKTIRKLARKAGFSEKEIELTLQDMLQVKHG